jgi:hypothetical protein
MMNELGPRIVGPASMSRLSFSRGTEMNGFIRFAANRITGPSTFARNLCVAKIEGS